MPTSTETQANLLIGVLRDLGYPATETNYADLAKEHEMQLQDSDQIWYFCRDTLEELHCNPDDVVEAIYALD